MVSVSTAPPKPHDLVSYFFLSLLFSLSIHVVIIAAVMALHVYITGITKGSRVRTAIFNKDYVERLRSTNEGRQLIEDFKTFLHKDNNTAADLLEKRPIEKHILSGWPDNGGGRFAQFLTFEEWYRFNNAQRAHLNYVEGISTVLTFLLIGGIRAPELCAIAGGVHILAREIFAYGYTNQGPTGRILGSVFSSISMFILFGAAVYTGIQIIQNKE